MRIVRLCFTLAVVSALAGLVTGGFAMAAQYADMWCMPTPVPACPTPCGCPILDTPNDRCESTIPLPDNTEITMYYCMTGASTICTSPTLSCGGRVYFCACWYCTPVTPPSGGSPSCFKPGCLTPAGEAPCRLTDKPPGTFCMGTYGCRTL